MTNTTNDLSNRKIAALDLVSDGLPHVLEAGAALLPAFRALRREGIVTITKLPGAWAIRTTDRSLW